jgi:hypothetical protein
VKVPPRSIEKLNLPSAIYFVSAASSSSPPSLLLLSSSVTGVGQDQSPACFVGGLVWGRKDWSQWITFGSEPARPLPWLGVRRRRWPHARAGFAAFPIILVAGLFRFECAHMKASRAHTHSRALVCVCVPKSFQSCAPFLGSICKPQEWVRLSYFRDWAVDVGGAWLHDGQEVVGPIAAGGSSARDGPTRLGLIVRAHSKLGLRRSFPALCGITQHRTAPELLLTLWHHIVREPTRDQQIDHTNELKHGGGNRASKSLVTRIQPQTYAQPGRSPRKQPTHCQLTQGLASKMLKRAHAVMAAGQEEPAPAPVVAPAASRRRAALGHLHDATRPPGQLFAACSHRLLTT